MAVERIRIDDLRKTMAKGLLGAAAALGLCAASPAAQAQSAWDNIILQDSYCIGNGGRPTGMGCEGVSSAESARERLYREKEEAAHAFALSYHQRLDAWLANIRVDEAAYRSALPPVDLPMVTEATRRDFICFRQNVLALVMLRTDPALFNMAGWHGVGVTHRNAINVHGMGLYKNGLYLLRAHLAQPDLVFDRDDPGHRAFLKALFAREIPYALRETRRRMNGFTPEGRGEVYAESINTHIGYDPRQQGAYASAYAKMDCHSGPGIRALSTTSTFRFTARRFKAKVFKDGEFAFDYLFEDEY